MVRRGAVAPLLILLGLTGCSRPAPDSAIVAPASVILMVVFIALPLFSVLAQSFFVTQNVFETVETERCTPGFFGGAELDPSLCSSADPVAAAYEQGVPMGGTLTGDEVGQGISFLAMAIQDPGTADGPGMPLQRLQLVKGWLDESGQQREVVLDVAGTPDNGATVDTRSCATRGTGHANLCTVWRDSDFDASTPAFYYLRVLENPSCRWSQRLCVAAAVDCALPETIKPGYEACCSAEHRPVIQERAWTSPIWYQP